MFEMADDFINIGSSTHKIAVKGKTTTFVERKIMPVIQIGIDQISVARVCVQPYRLSSDSQSEYLVRTCPDASGQIDRPGINHGSAPHAEFGFPGFPAFGRQMCLDTFKVGRRKEIGLFEV